MSSCNIRDLPRLLYRLRLHLALWLLPPGMIAKESPTVRGEVYYSCGLFTPPGETELIITGAWIDLDG